MSTPARTLAVRAVALATPLAGAALGIAAPWSVLWGGLGWCGFMVASLAGWGHVLERATRVRVDLGLRLAWGTAAVVVAAGPLLAAGALGRTALAALLVLGFVGHAWRVVTDPDPAAGPRALIATLRRDPQAAVLLALGLLVAINVADACAFHQTNVYDDDVAYTPLVKRLLDAGNLDEPFSFRRISAYGGQTVLQALVAVRGTLANPYLLDHGLGHLTTVLLVVGLARRVGADRFVTGLAVLVLALMPDSSINTASYWTGAALFLGLYRTVAEHADRPDRGMAAAALGAAALCTLRQNYIPVAVGFVGLALLARLDRPWAAAWRRERRAWITAVGVAGLALVPYAAASWRSNHTFLYPFQLGTFNPDIQMRPTVWSPWQELQFFLRVALESDPIRVMVPLAPVALACRDHRPGRPLLVFAVASALGFALLVHSFTLSDPPNLWRYAFGYATTLVVVIAIEGAGAGFGRDPAPSRSGVALGLTGRVLVVACLLAQLAATTKPVTRRLASVGGRLAAAARTHRHAEVERATPALYRELQQAVPAGARLAILLDEPAYLDFARNAIVNLDVPGYASEPPGMPFFRGPEPVAAYLRERGLRYLAFVRGDHSRYFYRRTFWVDRALWDSELWQVMGAYIVDALDSFTALAERYPRRFDRDGLVVVDLGAGGAP